MRPLIVFGFVIAGVLALAFAPANAKILGLDPDRFARLVYAGTLAFVLLGSLLWQYQGRLREAVADLTLWLLLLFVVLGGYTFRFELTNVAARIVSELMPGATVEGKGGEVMVT